MRKIFRKIELRRMTKILKLYVDTYALGIMDEKDFKNLSLQTLNKISNLINEIN